MPDRKIGFYPILLAIKTRLNAHALTSGYTLTNKTSPPSTGYPYIRYGDPYGGKHPMSAADTPLEDNIIHFHFWSDLDGDKEVSQMMNNVSQALDLDNADGTALGIDGYTQVILTLDYAEIIKDDTEPADIKTHGIMRIRVVMA